VLIGCEENGYGAENDKRDAHDRRQMRRAINGGRRQPALRSKEAEKKAKARNHKAETHDREAGADPREECAFRC